MEPHPAAAAGGGGGGEEGEAGRGAYPDTSLEGSMWRMGLAGDGGGEGDGARPPERPDQADCIYYLRTGAYGFGNRCRYNQPRDRGGTERCGELISSQATVSLGLVLGAMHTVDVHRPGTDFAVSSR